MLSVVRVVSSSNNRACSSMPVEFITSSRSCYEPGHAGLVSRCSFHPRQPVLACAIEGGRVCVYQQQNLIDSSIVLPFSHWKETVLHGNTQCPVLCLEWSVSSCRLVVVVFSLFSNTFPSRQLKRQPEKKKFNYKDSTENNKQI